MTKPLPAGKRRLRIVEIAVLADDDEFSGFVDRLFAGIEAGSPASDNEPLPRLVTWFDGAELPATTRSTVLGALAADGDPNAAAPPVRQPVAPVHPGDFW